VAVPIKAAVPNDDTTMRIISGQARGRRLSCPAGQRTRPTSDRVREALFSILGPPTPGLRVLDLFAGAGALGLEALSRGAAHCVFVERDRAAVRCLRENIDSLGYSALCKVHNADALQVLKGERVRGAAFDWVFIDPPYASDLAARALGELGGGTLLGDAAVVVVEHDRRSPPPEEAGLLKKTESRRYGDTVVSLYRRRASD